MGRPIISPAPERTALSKVIDYFIIYSHLKAGRPALMANGRGTQVSVHARPAGKQTFLRSMTLTQEMTDYTKKSELFFLSQSWVEPFG